MKTYSEKNKAYARKTYLKRKSGNGDISHAMQSNGKTYCGRFPQWNTIVSKAFTCSSCESTIKKKIRSGEL